MKKRQIAGLVFVLIWMCVIFRFSAKPSLQSSDMSHRVGRVICSIFISDYASLPADEQLALAESIDHPVRKLAHGVEYMILGVFLMNMFSLDRCRIRREIWYALGLGICYAASDEIHQYFVPGRSCQFTDVCIDTCGVIVGTMLVYWLIKLVRYMGSKNNGRKAA